MGMDGAMHCWHLPARRTQIWAALRGTRAAARRPQPRHLTKSSARRGSRGYPPIVPYAPAPPPAHAVPPPLMGCAASSDDRAEQRRRGRALGHSEASTTGLLVVPPQDQEPVAAAAAWRRRGCKVAPEPKEQGHSAALEPAMPGSPSFRYYCQKAAAVDALVAEAEASDGEGSVRITETSQAPKTNELTVEDTSASKIVEVSKPKQVTKWLRFRGLAIVAAWYSLFSRHRSKPSMPPSAEAAKSHPPDPAPAPAAAASSHT